ncbi:hypothetical protein [Nocardioides astragali]|uniref:Secreted protein n=1 Tax=Nocardioides astragali TaxID=1776736 RepID=A0ABW2N8Q6_9ACTN|nr:hypothetical protein [Nocardioides astragali]
MKRTLGVLVMTLGMVGATSGTAFAGERGGNGEPTPVKDHIASSICSFSGLEDMDHDDDGDFDAPVQPGVVQNWGSIPPEVRAILAAMGLHPGDSCRGA